MTATIVPAALDILEDAVLAALGTLAAYGPAAWWVLPVGTVDALLADQGEETYVSRAWVVQHQDGGGRQAPYMGNAGWSGLITVRCLSATDALARVGRDWAHTKLLALASPAGHSLRVRYSRPLDVPREPNRLYTRASIYEVVVRKL